MLTRRKMNVLGVLLKCARELALKTPSSPVQYAEASSYLRHCARRKKVTNRCGTTAEMQMAHYVPSRDVSKVSARFWEETYSQPEAAVTHDHI